MRVRGIARASFGGVFRGVRRPPTLTALCARSLDAGVVGAHPDLEPHLFTRGNDDIDDAGQFR
jgi:hypothetical protein